jgi:hypothetical protein
VSDLPDSVPHRYRRLVAGVTELDVGLDDEDDVVAATLAAFFEEHEDLRHAAVAELYEDSHMTLGVAARRAYSTGADEADADSDTDDDTTE